MSVTFRDLKNGKVRLEFGNREHFRAIDAAAQGDQDFIVHLVSLRGFHEIRVRKCRDEEHAVLKAKVALGLDDEANNLVEVEEVLRVS